MKDVHRMRLGTHPKTVQKQSTCHRKPGQPAQPGQPGQRWQLCCYAYRTRTALCMCTSLISTASLLQTPDTVAFARTPVQGVVRCCEPAVLLCHLDAVMRLLCVNSTRQKWRRSFLNNTAGYQGQCITYVGEVALRMTLALALLCKSILHLVCSCELTHAYFFLFPQPDTRTHLKLLQHPWNTPTALLSARYRWRTACQVCPQKRRVMHKNRHRLITTQQAVQSRSSRCS